MQSASPTSPRTEGWGWIYLVFFSSGFAALLYQLVWQRSLFALYGSNIEAVTVVVTAFMLGLGFGSLFGGWLSRNPDRPLLLMFGMIEIGIGLFGLISLQLFHWIGGWTSRVALLGAGLATFLLVLFPTLLMGATLPLLVGSRVQSSGNVGQSVGSLYFVNTLGSAVASLAAAAFLLGWLGQQNTVYTAAALNLTLGTAIVVRALVRPRKA